MTKVEKKSYGPERPYRSQSKSQSKSKSKPNEGASKILVGGMPPKIFDTPSFGFGFDFDFDWDFDWDNPIFLTQVSALNAKNFWRV